MWQYFRFHVPLHYYDVFAYYFYFFCWAQDRIFGGAAEKIKNNKQKRHNNEKEHGIGNIATQETDISI